MSDRRPLLRPFDIVRAGLELGLARFQLRGRQAKALGAQPMDQDASLDTLQQGLIERVAFVLPRVAARVPWRSDCLVQALAAERWLRGAGIATRLTLGVPKEKREMFEAHAWLSAGERVVTGGDINGYVPLTRD